MSQLIKLRSKIKSIRTTKKITYAMRLISRSFHAKLEKESTALNYYRSNVESTFKELAQHVHEWENPLLFPKDILNSSPLFIIVTSSKGLCGSFNTNLARYFHKHLFIETHQKPVFITVGNKAREFISEGREGPIIANFDTLTPNNYMYIMNDIFQFLIQSKKEFSSITFYSNFFKSFFIQQPSKTVLTPIKKDEFSHVSDEQEPFLEQDRYVIMNFLAERYIRNSILNILFQSILSEQSSRFLAMDTATSNADKLIDKLTLKYNKARQALITKELSELTASFVGPH